MSERIFLSSSVPESSKAKTRAACVKWRGLKMSADCDGGHISAGRNFCVTADGEVRAFGEATELGWKQMSERLQGTVSDGAIAGDEPVVPLGFCGIDGGLFLAFSHGGNVTLARLEPSESGSKILSYTECGLDAAVNGERDFERSFARYNVWQGGGDVISGEYAPRLLIYPDKAKMPFYGEWRGSAEAIAGCEVYKKTVVTVTKASEIFNSGWSVSADGEISVSGEPDGRSESVTSSVDTALYGYADESWLVPDTVTTESEPRVSYSIGRGIGADGAEIEFLTRVTETVLTKVSCTTKRRREALPEATGICVFGNRVIGRHGTKLFLSAAGSYVDYTLDTAQESDGGNAWYGTSQDGGDFTALCVYSSRPTAFKDGGLYELYGSENPFRLKKISEKGTFTRKSVCEADSVLFYASRDGVYAYSGSYPRNISSDYIPCDELRYGHFDCGIAGSDGIRYYIREPLASEADDEKPILVYDTGTGFWSVISPCEEEISCFASDGVHMYFITQSGRLFALGVGGKENLKWRFEASPELSGTSEIKYIEKMKMTVDFKTRGCISVMAELDAGERIKLCEFSGDVGVSTHNCVIRKSDHVLRKLCFECMGDVRIKNTEFILSGGGEVDGGKH